MHMEDSSNSSSNNTFGATMSEPFSEVGAILAAVFLVPMVVFGILANLITIVVIATSKTRSVVNILIISLSMSDLLASINSPLNLYRRTWGVKKWLLPDGLCKVYMGVNLWTADVTALHILLFSIVRLISMKWPYRYKEIKQFHMKITVTFIWLLTFGVGCIPGSLSFAAGMRQILPTTTWPDCTLDPAGYSWIKLYSSIMYPLFIYVPIVATTVMSFITAAAMLRRRAERRPTEKKEPLRGEMIRRRSEGTNKKLKRKENHAMLQLGLIVGSFMLGYIPLTAYIFYATTTAATIKTQVGAKTDWNFWLIAYILLRTSECLNPIFYNVASSKMRQETFLLLSKIFRCCPKREADPTIMTSSTMNYSSTKGRRATLQA